MVFTKGEMALVSSTVRKDQEIERRLSFDVINLRCELRKLGYYGEKKLTIIKKPKVCQIRYFIGSDKKPASKDGTVKEIRQIALGVIKSKGLTL